MLSSQKLSLYLSPRGGSNSWAQSRKNIDAWRRGALTDVRPLTLEFSPVLDCNADCPLCPYRRSRLDANTKQLTRGLFAPPNDVTVATRETTIRILDASAEGGVRGVLWTGGGEPTLLEALPELCEYSANLGMVNALYTNGFLLGIIPDLAERLLLPATGMVFARVSINALSPAAIKRHWGVQDPADVLVQWRGLENLLLTRERLARAFQDQGQSLPSIQISTIVEPQNIDDLLPICQQVAKTFEQSRKTAGPEDVMVVRPAVVHRPSGFSEDAHDPAVIQRIIEICGQSGPGRQVLQSAGVPVFLGFGLDQVESGAFPSYRELIRREYEQRDVCWAHGLFLTVGPDASVYPCMELNCDRRWVMGNLKTQQVDEVFRSDRWTAFLETARSTRWGRAIFHPHSRTSRLDKIARAIMNGALDEGEIEDLSEVSRTSHSLLLN